MEVLLFLSVLLLIFTANFVEIEDFAEPTNFEFMLIMSGDSVADEQMASDILEAVELMDTDEGQEISLLTVMLSSNQHSRLFVLPSSGSVKHPDPPGSVKQTSPIAMPKVKMASFTSSGRVSAGSR